MKKNTKHIKRILLCSPDYECTLAAARSLGKKGLYVIVGFNSRLSLTNFSKYVSEITPCPDVNKEKKFISWLIKNARENKFDILFPT